MLSVSSWSPGLRSLIHLAPADPSSITVPETEESCDTSNWNPRHYQDGRRQKNKDVEVAQQTYGPPLRRYFGACCESE